MASVVVAVGAVGVADVGVSLRAWAGGADVVLLEFAALMLMLVLLLLVVLLLLQVMLLLLLLLVLLLLLMLGLASWADGVVDPENFFFQGLI